ncbi:MAG: 2,3-bisphosphoglycerate-independent phosphoglycerate mutase [Anaerolineae bacterium]|jgi:2,3-bisphosphoglycerate-independent phosphoglycerate mutase|nr:2,3-bisphosphoglycerate-independent phosphoglycerate mutase [Anaerolineae bacterium]MDH7473429.1 2,3-bisphosphoglycerate-independent phosphoglycerate mutase [Anaerolineae bacterium]
MHDFELMRELHVSGQGKILLLVMDGLGGLPLEPGGPTELEAAHTPNLDALARESICGLSLPVGPGITPGSGPGHLALFGYDPFRYEIGRGVLEACGIGFPLEKDDLAARGNFCTVDAEGRIVDRRAGRIPTEKCVELVAMLRQITLPGVEVFVEPVQDYRFVLVLRGPGLVAELSETDPQQLGVPPLPVKALSPPAEATAALVNEWIAQARQILADQHPANMVLLRGLSKEPGLPQMGDIYGLRLAAIATYPMYRGVAKLVGMDVLPTGDSIEDEIATLKEHWEEYDFFYFHVKKTDSAGEDGDFARKVSIIEHVDEVLPEILALKPAVVIVTGDHSTPALLKSHSWHPVPTLLWSPYCRADEVTQFGERACMRGGLGTFPATDLLPLAMANALRLTKYGA